ncbi:MAG TPA: NAD(P)-dependent alcohol dehydrogenase, partial [Acidimicrobiales bacterium]|nr:NAD(P)-dependent alcohol dehydrogenase [Acidimicrobiales bacterium]
MTTTAAPGAPTQDSPPASSATITQDRFGEDPHQVLRLLERPTPTAAEDEVLVRVRAVSLDRGTWHLLTGLPLLMRVMGYGFRRPAAENPVRALAGTVEAVGSAVTTLAVGDEVFGSADGALAEHVVTTPDLLARKPSNLSFEEAAAFPISAVAALQAVRDHVAPGPGDHVLVIGGVGNVGAFAVQLAKAFGAEVTAVTGPADVERALALGADHVVDHSTTEITDAGRRYDAIVDTAGNRPLPLLRRALTDEGRLVIVGGEQGGRVTGGFGRSVRAPLLSRFVSQRLSALNSKENGDDL